MTSYDGTWIAETADGVVVARLREGELLVDRPSTGAFREARPLVIERGHLVVDGVVLQRVAPLPLRLAESAGWYDGDSRRILLIDRIEWRDGWPRVGTPSDEPQPAPIT